MYALLFKLSDYGQCKSYYFFKHLIDSVLFYKNALASPMYGKIGSRSTYQLKGLPAYTWIK